MSRTRFYTVHLRLWSTAPDREAVFVRDGFSWGAFFFSFLWALSQRMWGAALIAVGLSAALGLFSDLAAIDPVADGALALALALLIGFEANDFRRRALERRGFVAAGVIAASDLAAAEQRFFSKT